MLEKKVNELIEESCLASSKGQLQTVSYTAGCSIVPLHVVPAGIADMAFVLMIPTPFLQ